MISYSSPFSYFVEIEWRCFVFALFIYLTVYFLSGWKDFYKFW